MITALFALPRATGDATAPVPRRHDSWHPVTRVVR